MHFLKQHKVHIIAFVCIVAVLCIAFFMGEASPMPPTTADIQSAPDAVVAEVPLTIVEETAEGHRELPKDEKDAVETVQVTPVTEAPIVPPDAEREEEPALPQSPEQEQEADSALYCTLSVRCDNALGKAGEKEAFLPQNGVIYEGQEVAFALGESVFDVLLREMRMHDIQLEFSQSPMYQSVYIEGICNLYERDCGNLSGWVYKVNGEKPGYDCSNYLLQAGDRIEWIYTCDLGRDV